MKYIINPAGNRVVYATPEETRALRPRIRSAFRGWKANGGDIDDFCQEVEIIVWKAVEDQRILGTGFPRPVDALLSFAFSVAWNVWRNYFRKRSTRSEVSCPDEDLPEVPGPQPDGRLDARETLLRLARREDIARILIDALANVPREVRYGDIPRSTYDARLARARRWAHDMDNGHWKAPTMPTPTTWKKRKKQR